MNCLITSSLGNTQQILEKVGYFVMPTDKDEVFEMIFESVDELFHLADIIDYDLLIHKRTSKEGSFVVEIFDKKKFVPKA